MIRAVFFDMYGTLAGFSPSRFELQSQACADFGIRVTPEGVLKGYAAADAYMNEQNAVEPPGICSWSNARCIQSSLPCRRTSTVSPGFTKARKTNSSDCIDPDVNEMSSTGNATPSRRSNLFEANSLKLWLPFSPG